jgi:hypothetical protein
VIADTLFRRRGKKVHGAGWFHDGSAAGQVKLVFGNNWVVAAIIVTLLQTGQRIVSEAPGAVTAGIKTQLAKGPQLIAPC